jgi:anion-transporting  ArsA/GET3 family ATPase
MTLDQLYRRRLLVVAGKGGVGKTTIASALALEAARRGKRVLLCEVDGVARAAQLLHEDPAPVGQVVDARCGVSLMAVEGKAALAEYLQLIIPVRRLLGAVFNSRIYQYFVAAAPGLKELMTIGKIWYEVDRRDEATDRLRWDLVILDAPATGHSLQYLRMPAAAREAFTSGLVHREAQRLVEQLTDPTRTAVNLVTTAEEMPVNETVSMYRQLHDELKMPTGMLFVNRVHQSQFTDDAIAKLRATASRTKDAQERAVLTEVAARAAEDAGWARLNARYLARLREQVTMSTVQIPFLFTEEFGFAEVKHIADRIRDAAAAGREQRA